MLQNSVLISLDLVLAAGLHMLGMPKLGKQVEHVFTGMEIDESLDLHIRSWKIQPFAWSVIGLFVLAGALGLFGTGILSKVSKDQGGAGIRYERFFRFGTSENGFQG